MWKSTLSSTLLLVAATTLTSWAQAANDAPLPGRENTHRSRGPVAQIDRLSDYLDLSQSQADEWRAMVQTHLQKAPDRTERRLRMEAWREEFDRVAAAEGPDLERLGELALELHRAHELQRSRRGLLLQDLQTILTPEQSEKLEALQVARKLFEPGGRRSPRHHRR